MGSRGKLPELTRGQLLGSRRKSTDIVDEDDGRNLGHLARFVLCRVAQGKRDVGRFGVSVRKLRSRKLETARFWLCRCILLRSVQWTDTNWLRLQTGLSKSRRNSLYEPIKTEAAK